MGFDEGFWRVEWIAHVEGAALQTLLGDPDWARGKVTLANVYGVSGVLVIPETSVRALAVPNPEWLRNDLDGPLREKPYNQFVVPACPTKMPNSERTPPCARWRRRMKPTRTPAASPTPPPVPSSCTV